MYDPAQTISCRRFTTNIVPLHTSTHTNSCVCLFRMALDGGTKIIKFYAHHTSHVPEARHGVGAPEKAVSPEKCEICVTCHVCASVLPVQKSERKYINN